MALVAPAPCYTRAVLDTDEDARRLTPLGILLELAAVGIGVALLWRLPLGGAVTVLAWPRLLGTAAPVAAALLVLERRLSRGRRAAEWVRYPSLLPVLVALLGVSVALVAIVNRLPSATRALRFEEYAVREGEHVVMAMRGAVMVARGPEDLFVEVPKWRGTGVEQFQVSSEELVPGRSGEPPVLTIEERDGFLGIPYVASVRLVAR
jgi:hypothetical protein